MFLTHQQQLRTETDESVIATLVRKGWVETVPPTHDPATQHSPEWNDGAWIIRDLTPEELAAAARKVWPTVANFWAEFTLPEKAAIIESQSTQIKLLNTELAMWRGEVWSDNPHVIGGLDALVAASIITADRAAAIVATPEP